MRVAPLAAGGGQERGRRGGTENVAALVGLGEAARLARPRSSPTEGARLAGLRDRLEAGLLAAVPDSFLNAAAGARLPTATSVAFPGAEAETLVAALDLEGIAVSAGSACHAGTTAPSRVLVALGLSPADAKATLRISFGRTTYRGGRRAPPRGRPAGRGARPARGPDLTSRARRTALNG